jgi:O-antigen ligase
VAICGARAALAGFIVALGGAVAARGRRHLLAALGVAALLGAGAVGVTALTQRKRFDDLLALRDTRWDIWRVSLAIVAEHPLLGTAGPAGWREAYREAHPRVVPERPSEFAGGAAPHAHNTPLAFAGEYGIPYALLWFALLVTVVLALRGAAPGLRGAAVGMALMALVFGQFERLDGEASRALWLGLGILVALRHLDDGRAGAPAAGGG